MNPIIESKVDALMDEYRPVPVIDPEQIREGEGRQVIVDLVELSRAQEIKELPQYGPPKKVKVKNPRGLFRRIGDRYILTFRPNQAPEVKDRIEELEKVASAHAKYKWLTKYAPIVDEAILALRGAYTHINQYRQGLNASVTNAERILEQNETEMGRLVASLDNQEDVGLLAKAELHTGLETRLEELREGETPQRGRLIVKKMLGFDQDGLNQRYFYNGDEDDVPLGTEGDLVETPSPTRYTVNVDVKGKRFMWQLHPEEVEDISQGRIEELMQRAEGLDFETLLTEAESLIDTIHLERARDIYGANPELLRRRIPQLQRVNEYIRLVIRDVSIVTENCEQTMEELEESIGAAQSQELRIKRAIRFYERHTSEQITAERATDFLDEVDKVAVELHQDIQARDTAFDIAADTYQERAEERDGQVPDLQRVRARQEQRQL
ncbi:hypothetical protein HOD38_03840 [archaeon]|jgi:hypothetical protein|nr:hypothetical protein [archaeon]MBT4397373.1 hypothetical protein [archaeon]MBT4440753.1 hypothetical protein [archaeon]